MIRTIVIAEDDALLAEVLEECLQMKQQNVPASIDVVVSYGPTMVRAYLSDGETLVVLDGSVAENSKVLLSDVDPKRTIVFSGDDEFIREAKIVGITTFQKGSVRLADLSQTILDRAYELTVRSVKEGK